jgi:hypothetical protein
MNDLSQFDLAQAVLILPPMNRRVVPLLLLALGLVCSLAGVASAATVDETAVQVTKLETQRATLEAERKAGEKTYQDKTAQIAKLKAQPSSWSRDRKLQSLLRESKDMATTLDKKAEQVRVLDGEIAKARQALVTAIDKELAASPAPSEARRATLTKKRTELAGGKGVKKIKVADEHIDPFDDAEDLDYKADALERTEKQLLAEEERLSRRAGYYRKQAKLTKARARADEQDLFRDDGPRRTTSSAEAQNDGAGAPTGDNSPPPSGPADPSPGGLTDADDGGFEATPEAPTAGGGVDITVTTGARGSSSDVTTDPALILGDVVDSGTLEELRKAERSGDPESRAKAAERAAKEVKARVEKIKQRRLEMEKRAKQLRDKGE